MLNNTTKCPFCGSEAKKRTVKVKASFHGITKIVLPHKKWFCENCKRHFRYEYDEIVDVETVETEK